MQNDLTNAAARENPPKCSNAAAAAAPPSKTGAGTVTCPYICPYKCAGLVSSPHPKVRAKTQSQSIVGQ